ncbi:MAG: damage-control phosphatase ARMT1 family protein, partial [Candidatus Helarchaeota archaeon]
LRSVMALLLNEDWTKSPPELAGKVYKIITKESGIIDPYKDLKKKSNDLVLGIYNKLKDECLNSKDPIIHALRFAVAGNIIDFGASDKFDFQKTIDMVVNAKFEIDKSDKLKEKLETSESILYFADNSGEIVLDKIFLELILKYYPNIKKITFLVKAGPIINDATMEDVEYVSLKSLPNIQFKTIGNDLYPESPSRTSEEVKNWIFEHDIVIAKGQGNYEALSIYKGINKIFFLLMAKCPIVARDLNVKEQSFVVYY